MEMESIIPFSIMTNIKIPSNKLKLKINTINSYEGRKTKSEQMEKMVLDEKPS